jgi:tetratricopeptide (TPR) repeat protein
MLGKNSQLKKSGVRPDALLEDRISFDHLLTMCKYQLGKRGYVDVLLGIGNILKTHGELQRARQTFDEVMTFGQSTEHSEFIAEALLARGEVYSREGRWRESNRDLAQSRVLFQKARDFASLAKVENILGTCYAEQGLLRRANTYFSKALQSAERTSEKPLSATILMNLGIIRNIIGKCDEALHHYRRALPLFELSGDMTRVAEIYHNMGMSYLSKGDYPAAIQEFDKSLEYSMKLQSPGLIAISKLGKATVHFRMADLALALAYCNQAMDGCQKSDQRIALADAYKLKGMVLGALKQYQLAESHLYSSIRINEQYGNLLNLGETWYELGVLKKSMRRKTEATEAFRKALEHFRKVGAATEVQRTNGEMTALQEKRK